MALKQMVLAGILGAAVGFGALIGRAHVRGRFDPRVTNT